MQRLKEILGRESERFNLQNTVLCVLVVLALTAIAFGVVHLKFSFQGESDAPAREPVSLESRN